MRLKRITSEREFGEESHRAHECRLAVLEAKENKRNANSHHGEKHTVKDEGARLRQNLSSEAWQARSWANTEYWTSLTHDGMQ